MTDIAVGWAERFGLALAPLFATSEIEEPENHSVLLDGGYGSFAMSSGPSARDYLERFGSWAWSSNLAHHIAVTQKEVIVTRWDKPEPEVLTRSSVDKRLEAFYDYLIADRVRSNQKVVDHLLDLFRRIRSLVADARQPDDLSVAAFLRFLELIGKEAGEDGAFQAAANSLVGDDQPLRRLSVTSLDTLRRYALRSDVLARSLLPKLAIRHAGSEIFQEAHFELVRSPTPDLFGYVGPAEAKIVSRGGAHFTPPAIARSVCEQTLSQVKNITKLDVLTVLDPACGSGAFLHEVVRTLHRMEFSGRLNVIGRDISRSAIAMAEFALRHGASDWSPVGGIYIDLKVADSLNDALPPCDVVIMNPPFISWTALEGSQREQVKEILGSTLVGRSDLSMAFVTHAMKSLNQGGVLGALLPSSLLTLQAAEKWRASLLEKGSIRMIASLGDHGLFAHALVSIAAIVLNVGDKTATDETGITALVTGNSADATGGALRALRRQLPDIAGSSQTADWRLFKIDSQTLAQRPTWRLVSPEANEFLSKITSLGARQIDELFDVKQGVRTGNNKVFVLDNASLNRLPRSERVYFKPAIINESIALGRISSNHHVFYPYGNDGDSIYDENDLKQKLPQFYRAYLLPNKESLSTRSSILEAGRSDWWGLSRRRTWALHDQPRIVSKYFGGAGGFAVDTGNEHIVVQGHAWFPRWTSDADGEARIDSDEQSLLQESILYAYAALMNSRSFSSLVEVFSPHVAGGQFDLSPRYVNKIPIPDLPSLMSDEDKGLVVAKLAELGRALEPESKRWQSGVERLVSGLYGSSFIREE